MADKFKSRKFMVTVLVTIALLVAKQGGLDIDEATVWGIVATVTGYNFGQGYVDGQKEKHAPTALQGVAISQVPAGTAPVFTTTSNGGVEV